MTHRRSTGGLKRQTVRLMQRGEFQKERKLATYSVSLLVILLLAIQASLLASSAAHRGPVHGESAQLSAGSEHLTRRSFDLCRNTGPLVRAIAALPVIIVGYRAADGDAHLEQKSDQTQATENAIGALFIARNGERSLFLLAIARLACVLVTIFGGIVCFLWSREIWGNASAGLVSLVLWCFDPNILSNGCVVSPECGAATFGLAASFYFSRFLKRGSWNLVIFAGVATGLAQLCSSTWLCLSCLWPFLYLVHLRFADDRASSAVTSPWNVRFPHVQLVCLMILGTGILNAGYAFQGTMTRLGQYTFVSDLLTNGSQTEVKANRFRDVAVGQIPLPFPKHFVLAMDAQAREMEKGQHVTYLDGEWKKGGWWHYHAYAFAVTTPLGCQLIVAISLITAAVQFRRTSCVAGTGCARRIRSEFLDVLAPPALFAALISVPQIQVSQHVRYALPIYGFLFVFSGIVSVWFVGTNPRGSGIN